jgi:hypothetical protein
LSAFAGWYLVFTKPQDRRVLVCQFAKTENFRGVLQYLPKHDVSVDAIKCVGKIQLRDDMAFG